MATQIQLRRDSSADWASNDPALAEGELGYDTDAKLLKVGDGSTTWSGLPSFTTSSGITSIVEDTSPQLGGDLDLNSFGIDFPTTANITDCLDEDDMSSNSATALATQQSIKAYVDAAYTDEKAQDAVGTIISGAGTVTVTYDDGTPLITVSGAAASVAGASHADLDDLGYASAGHTGFVSDTFLTTVSGDIVAQIPTDYITDAEMTTISGDIVAQIPTDYITDAEMTTISGDIIDQIPTDYITDAEMTTISGDIVAQIGGGAFTDLSDVPSDYTDDGGKYVRVKATEDGLEFATVSGAGGLSNVVEDTTPQLGGELDMNAMNISMTPTGGGSDDTACGLIATLTVDTNGVGVGAGLFMASDGNFDEADADTTATMPCTALALETGTGSKKVLLLGYIRNDGWNWTPGGVIYVSATQGELTQTAPTGTGDQVQIVGYATHADRMYFNPQLIIGEVI